MKSTFVNSVLILFAVAVSGVCSPSETLAAPELRVGYVDLQKAISMTKEGSKAKDEYEDEVEKAQKQLDKKKKEFTALQEKYQKQRDSLSKEARASREEKLIAMEKDLRRSFEDSQEGLRRQNIKMVNDLIKKMRTVVADVGDKEGFTVILEKGAQAVLYADNEIDITDKVVDAYNSGKY